MSNYISLQLSDKYLIFIFNILCAEDDDFKRQSGSIVFVPNGPDVQNFSIPITADDTMESNERLIVKFSSTDLDPDMPVIESTVTIIDDDIS